ncbi:TolC family protein [bacterium]|nr:TolC family protein [bacterium]
MSPCLRALCGLIAAAAVHLLSLVPAGADADDNENYVEIPAAQHDAGGVGGLAQQLPDPSAVPAEPEDAAAPSADELAGPDAAALLALDYSFDGPALSLDEAVSRVLEGNPELEALEYEQRAAYGRKVQAGLLPNPEFSAELSEFMGTAEMRFLRSAVSGVGISQLIEHSCKRIARCDLAEREGQLALAELERRRLDILLEVSEAYYAALIAQQRLALAAKLEGLLTQVQEVVALKVEGGKAARLELTRSELELRNTALQRQQRERELDAAMLRLSSLWGGQGGEFSHVAGALLLPEEVPASEQLQALLDQSPDALLWDAEKELRSARLALASAEARKDYTISGGLARYEETDSFGFSLGISFPLKRRNRNEGAILEAQEYLNQVESLRQADLRRQYQALTEQYARLANAHELARSIEQDILPVALESFELTQLGYRYGKFTLLDALDAQRVLIEAQAQHLEALAEYQLASVQIERLIASPLGDALQPQATTQNESAGSDAELEASAGAAEEELQTTITTTGESS